MPIRASLRHFYGSAWRTETRPRILERAKNCCERCKVPNHAVVARYDKFPGWWCTLDGEAHRPDGSLAFHFRGSEVEAPDKVVRIVLTIAHLNRVPGDDREENLAALCQFHHLRHDLESHVQHSRETRIARKDAARPMLSEGA